MTKAGTVYAVGDSFAQVHGIKNETFGFYELKVDMKVLEEVKKKEEVKSDDCFLGKLFKSDID